MDIPVASHLPLPTAHARQLTPSTPAQKGWYPSIYTSLHDAITSNDPARLAVQPEQAIWTMRLIELGLQSSREGRVIDVEK